MQTGIETLLRRHAHWLRTGRFGLLSHQAAVASDGGTSAQHLRDALGDRLCVLWGPEHGYFGTGGAGAPVAGETHPAWHIPVFSLYGKSRRPTPSMLRGLDGVVVDLQDLGARCYTYLATLRRMLEACAEAGIAVLVADRPAPLPQTIDGPILEPGWRSFVADAPLPMAYGMTPGETARWLCTHLGLNLDLRIARCTGWRRQPRRPSDAPEWISPSPAIRCWESAETYLTSVFVEAFPALDNDRAGNMAFRVLGAPWLPAQPLCERLAGENLPGIAFHPHRYRAGPGPWQGTMLDGLRISVTDPLRVQPVRASVALLEAMGRLVGREDLWNQTGNRPDFFDQLYGTDKTRRALERGVPWREIAASWQPALEAYRVTRAEALLYGPSRAG